MPHPVRDYNGHIIHRVRVALNEMTCTGCGEVAMISDVAHLPRCPHCGSDENGGQRADAPPLIPTLAYLRPGEWEPAA